MISKILVPLDGSRAAEAVLPWVKRFARATNARIVLLAAVYEPGRWIVAPIVDLEEEAREAERYLRSTRARLTRVLDFNVETEVVRQLPASAILDRAQGVNANLIAMATHGRSGVGRWVLGSVADKVIHAAETPVLLIRAPKPEAIAAPLEIRHVLVPLDGSDVSRSVLPFTADLAKALRASITLFHVVVPPVLVYPGAQAIGWGARVLQQMEAGAKAFLADAAEELATGGVKATVMVSIGDAADGIVHAAESEGAAFIAMSTHGRSGAGRMVLGSVADAVVRRSNRPVVLVRPATNKEVSP